MISISSVPQQSRVVSSLHGHNTVLSGLSPVHCCSLSSCSGISSRPGCSSSSSSWRNGGSNQKSIQPPAAAAAAASSSTTATRRQCCTQRTSVIAHAWWAADQQQATQQLWGYDGSCVKQLSLRELELLHRLSFGHRNQRSYLVVLYTPGSPACQAFEAEVERLASGLRHEPAFVAAALDVSSSEAATFVSNMLKVDSVPAVLLYPEAARGCLKFLGPDMSAVGMLAAINKARRTALPPTATSPGAAEWQLVEAATPLAVSALRAAAASGDTEAVVAALQQQMQPIQPTPLVTQQVSNYWTQGKAQLWGGLLLCSLLFLAWDLRLSDVWEDWCLMRRQKARLQGRKFTAQENLDDTVTLMMKALTGQRTNVGAGAAAGQQPPADGASSGSSSSVQPAGVGDQLGSEQQRGVGDSGGGREQNQQSSRGNDDEGVEVLLHKQGDTWAAGGSQQNSKEKLSGSS